MTMDAFTLLEKDHRQVERLLEALGESEEGAERQSLLQQLEVALTAHMQFEEQEVYPIVQREMDAETAEEAGIEHGLAREGMAKMKELVAAPGFGAAVEMVKGGISHHVEEEEGEIFPALRKMVRGDQADTLRRALLDAKAAAGLPPLDLDGATKEELVEMAREMGVDITSSMTKEQVKAALAG